MKLFVATIRDSEHGPLGHCREIDTGATIPGECSVMQRAAVSACVLCSGSVGIVDDEEAVGVSYDATSARHLAVALWGHLVLREIKWANL